MGRRFKVKRVELHFQSGEGRSGWGGLAISLRAFGGQSREEGERLKWSSCWERRDASGETVKMTRKSCLGF